MLLELNTVQNVDRRFLRKNDRRWDVYTSGFQIADMAFRSLKAVIDIYMFVNFMAIFLFFKRARETRMKLAGRLLTQKQRLIIACVYIISILNMYYVAAQIVGQVLIFIAGCKS